MFVLAVLFLLEILVPAQSLPRMAAKFSIADRVGKRARKRRIDAGLSSDNSLMTSCCGALATTRFDDDGVEVLEREYR